VDRVPADGDARHDDDAGDVIVAPAPRIAFVLGFVLAVTAQLAAADGGRLRAREAFEERTVSVWTSPTPLRVGLVEILVVIEPARGSIRGASAVPVEVEAWAGGQRLVARGSGAAAVAASDPGAIRFDLAEPGPTEIQVRVGGDGRRDEVRAVVEVEPAPSPFREQWPALLLPFVVVALFAAGATARRRDASARADRREGDHSRADSTRP
jgi:hypothetical protein